MSDEPTPVDTPFDEYEHMRALRCECGGALSWGDRESIRLAPPEEHLVLDRYVLTCAACRRERPIEFLCDTSSESYSGLAASAYDMALGLGPDGAAALLAAAAGESPVRARRAGPGEPAREAKPARRSKPKPGRAAKPERRSRPKPKTKTKTQTKGRAKAKPKRRGRR